MWSPTACAAAFATTLVALGAAAEAQDAAPTQIERFAFLVGANDGGADRTLLRYAVGDTEAIATVLERYGGVPGDHRLVLLQPTRAALEAGFAAMAPRLDATRGDGRRAELVFYYSGHSDDRGLMLGDERFTYGELKAALRGLDADVRIAILDSCSSGAFTRAKGGVRRPSFMVDASSKVSGHAYLTSASADEAAQESDRVGGSYFTHALLTGMRGAADTTGDGRVTLNEAYEFAYHETLARTEGTQTGAQHPNYHIELAGSGDLVLTDLRKTSARLVFEESVDGRLHVRDAKGALVAELRKTAGRAIALGLEPGTYQVTLDRPRELRRADLTLVGDAPTRVALADLAVFEGEATVSRGGNAAVVATADPVVYLPLSAGIAPGISTNQMVDGERFRNSFAFGFIISDVHEIDGVQASYIGSSSHSPLEGLQFGTIYAWTKATVEGAQGSAVISYNRGLSGAQGAGVVSYADGDIDGVQVAGVATYCKGNQLGVSAAGVFNGTEKKHDGLQFSGLINLSGGNEGVQVSGLVNASDDVTGVQIGLINVADDVTGLQLGLINVADSVDGVSFGLVPIVSDGLHEATVWTSDTAYANAGFKLGSKHVYTLLGAGAQQLDGNDYWHFTFGLGGHVPVGDLWFDIDLVGAHFAAVDEWFDGKHLVGKLRLMLGYQIAEHFAIYGGPSVNGQVTLEDEMPYEFGIEPFRRWREGDTRVGLWPGFVFGIQI